MARLRLGIFGGTFDPPHIGHQILAAEACEQLNLQRVLWVVTPNPPHKTEQVITPLSCRLKMVAAALADESRFELSRVDVDRPPPHYAVDTVMRLRSTYPGFDLIYLMGGDSLHDLPTWYKPVEFVRACDAIGIMQRPGFVIELNEMEQHIPGLSKKILSIHAPLIEISSKEIRLRAAQGRTFRYYLPGAVYKFVQEENLYR